MRSIPARLRPPSTFAALPAAALAVLLVAASTAGAQTIPSPYDFIDTNQEAGIFAGQAWPDRGAFDFGPGPGLVLGARYGIQVGGPFSIEGVLSTMPTTRQVINPVLPAGERVIGEADAMITMIEARFKFSLTGPRTWNGLSPFVLAGAGAAFDLEDEQAIDQELPVDQRFEFSTTFLGSLGGGVRWFPAERILIRTDLYVKFWKIGTPRGFGLLEEQLGPVEEDQWVRAPTITIGAALRF